MAVNGLTGALDQTGAIIRATTVSFSWSIYTSQPENGGLDTYTIRDSTSTIIVTSDVKSITITGLTPATEYLFVVVENVADGAQLYVGEITITTDSGFRVRYVGNGNTGGSVPIDASGYPVNGTGVGTVKAVGGLVKSGYKLTEWNTAADGTGTSYTPGSSITVTSDITLYAIWGQTYTITYDGNGNTNGSPPIDAFGYLLNDVGIVENVSVGFFKLNYILTEWNTAADGTGTSYTPGSSITVTSDITLYAIWIPTYTITYNGNGNTAGTSPFDNTKYYSGDNNTTVRPKGTLFKSSHYFTGWNTEADGTGTSYAEHASITVLSNITLYAIWAPGYTITYDKNTTSLITAPIDSSGYSLSGTDLGTIKSGPRRNGYTFTEWNTLANGTGTSYTPGSSIIVDSDITLYAIWEEKTYTITYDICGGSGTTPTDSGTYNFTATANVNNGAGLSRIGYRFVGWTLTSAGTGNVYTTTFKQSTLGSAFDSTITFYAKWNIKDYSVVYNANGGSGSAPATVTKRAIGQSITLAGAGGLTRTGYTFGGWSQSTTGAAITGTSFTLNATTLSAASVSGTTVNLYAVWNDTPVFTSVSAAAVSDNQISVSWGYAGATPTSFRVETATGTVIASGLPGSVTTYSGGAPSGTYAVRVRAVRSAGDLMTSPTNEITVTSAVSSASTSVGLTSAINTALASESLADVTTTVATNTVVTAGGTASSLDRATSTVTYLLDKMTTANDVQAVTTSLKTTLSAGDAVTAILKKEVAGNLSIGLVGPALTSLRENATIPAKVTLSSTQKSALVAAIPADKKSLSTLVKSDIDISIPAADNTLTLTIDTSGDLNKTHMLVIVPDISYSFTVVNNLKSTPRTQTVTLYRASGGSTISVTFVPGTTSKPLNLFGSSVTIAGISLKLAFLAAPAANLDDVIMPAPTGVSATAGVEQVTVSWSSVANAVSYTVYGTYNGGASSLTPVTGVTGLSTTITGLTAGVEYSFTVVAVGDNEPYADSDPSTPATAMPTGGGGGPGVVCFLGNAPVLTPSGYKRIDSLAVGDMVRTADGRDVAIQRVKHQRVLAPSAAVNPYVIPAGTWGATQNLAISPRHAVAVPGRGMVEARELGLRQLSMKAAFDYYNLELPEWDNMIVAGVEVESLAPKKRVVMTAAQFRDLVGSRSVDLAKLARIATVRADGSVDVMLTRKARRI